MDEQHCNRRVLTYVVVIGVQETPHNVADRIFHAEDLLVVSVKLFHLFVLNFIMNHPILPSRLFVGFKNLPKSHSFLFKPTYIVAVKGPRVVVASKHHS